MQLGELRDIEAEISRLGFPIVAVTADRPEKVRDAGLQDEGRYQIYSDSTMTAATAFGIVWQADSAFVQQYKEFGIDLEEASGLAHHQLPVPSVFLVGKGGKIRWVYSNPDHRVRPENAELMEAARDLAG